MARPKIHFVTYYCFWFIWKIEDLELIHSYRISWIKKLKLGKILRRCLAETNNQSVFTPCFFLKKLCTLIILVYHFGIINVWTVFRYFLLLLYISFLVDLQAYILKNCWNLLHHSSFLVIISIISEHFPTRACGIWVKETNCKKNFIDTTSLGTT